MASISFLELMSTLTFLSLSTLLLCFALLSIHVAYSLVSFLVFYIKESLQSSGRPPIAGTVFHQLVYLDTLFDFQLRLARRHGHRSFRLIKPSHSDLFIYDPASVEHLLRTNFYNYTRGEYNYDIFHDLLGDGIFAVDGEKWRQQRKLASYEFSTKILRNFSSVVFRSNAEKLAKKIAQSSADGNLIDMQDLLMKSTLDSIFKVGFGVELDTLSGSSEQGVQFSKAFDDSSHIVFRRFSDIFWKAKRYLNVGMEARLKKNLRVIDDFVFQLIRNKKQLMQSGLERNKEDILSRFIMASEKEPQTMSDRYLRDIILNFILAGKDTTANTLTWFFYMLCKHPDVQEKIVMEIRETTGVEGVRTESAGFTASLIGEVLDKMHYLHATLTETIRLYPVVADGKCAEEDDVLPSGIKVKKGDGVNYLIYAMGRMTDLWGEDAEEFRPERWLDSDGTFKPECPFKFVSFNAGPRICLGKEFAYRQMKILAAVLLHFFRFKLGDESFVAKYRVMFTLHMDKGLHLLAFHRSN